MTGSVLATTAMVAMGLAGTAANAVTDPTAAAVKVEVRSVAGEFELYRDGQPYVVRGAGVGIDDDDDIAYLELLKRHGGNSFRTWHVPDAAVLDRAQELGLTVALCLDVARERHGFDYDDPVAVRDQFERLKSQVLEYRNHPALLFWIIGNELNHDYTNPRVYEAVNDISRMIHELDPNHPTTTATAGINRELADEIRARAPDLDFLSVQVYGMLDDLKKIVAEIDLELPLMVTEWGTIGHWEVPTTSWGAPLELDSTRKAERYLLSHEQILQPMSAQLIGDYAFLWGQKQERTPTWYGMFTAAGERTEAVDALQKIWTGAWPGNRAPRIVGMSLDGKYAPDDTQVSVGGSFTASVHAADRDGDSLAYDWRLMRESQARQAGGDAEEVPEDLSRLIARPADRTVQVTTPEQAGPYRLFVYVRDSHGGVAHANIPLFVADPEIPGRER